MQSTLGWTFISSDLLRRVSTALQNSGRDTRDEIGFGILHQAFADRFFPGTSVLHTRVRYVLFVAWIYRDLAETGAKVEDVRRRRLLTLTRRLVRADQTGIIGKRVSGENRLSSQPPDSVYWAALRTWKILGDERASMTAVRRILAESDFKLRDRDDVPLDAAATFLPFESVPPAPENWDLDDAPITFGLETPEKRYLRERLQATVRSDGQESLLARLVRQRKAFAASDALPLALDDFADSTDQRLLAVARDAAHLAGLGRVLYGAMIEQLAAAENVALGHRLRAEIPRALKRHREAALRCDLAALRAVAPAIAEGREEVYRACEATVEFARRGHTEIGADLIATYRAAEVARKGADRARLGHGEKAEARRRSWNPEEHGIQTLHYRWDVVQRMLEDLAD